MIVYKGLSSVRHAVTAIPFVVIFPIAKLRAGADGVTTVNVFVGKPKFSVGNFRRGRYRQKQRGVVFTSKWQNTLKIAIDPKR
jgi:hypothetical protein